MCVHYICSAIWNRQFEHQEESWWLWAIALAWLSHLAVLHIVFIFCGKGWPYHCSAEKTNVSHASVSLLAADNRSPPWKAQKLYWLSLSLDVFFSLPGCNNNFSKCCSEHIDSFKKMNPTSYPYPMERVPLEEECLLVKALPGSWKPDSALPLLFDPK